MPGPKVRCKTCGDIIQSEHVHDFVRCDCKAIFVDGGADYFRCGFPDGTMEDHMEVLGQPPAEKTANPITRLQEIITTLHGQSVLNARDMEAEALKILELLEPKEK